MFCPMCGAPNEDDADFCGNCGAAMNPEDAMPEMSQDDVPVEITLDEPGEEVEVTEVAIAEPPPPPPAPVLPSVPSSGLAVASLVSGVAGLTLLPIVGGVLAIVLGYMARREIRQRPDEVSGDGLALAGIVMGWISVGMVVVACLFLGGLAACGVIGSLGAGGY